MADRRRAASQPAPTPTRTERRIIKVRVPRRWGPARIGYLLRPEALDRAPGTDPLQPGPPDPWTAPPAGRYAATNAAPGELVHVDIKKLGNIPDGGGHKMLGRAGGQEGRAPAGRATATSTTPSTTTPASPTARSSPTRRRRPPRHSGAGPRRSSPSRDHRRAGADRQRLLLPVTPWPKPSAPDHAQANPALPAPDQRQGRTVQPHPARRMGLRKALPLRSRTRDAFPDWLHTYNHHRGHTALRGQPPASRVPNLTGQYT